MLNNIYDIVPLHAAGNVEVVQGQPEAPGLQQQLVLSGFAIELKFCEHPEKQFCVCCIPLGQLQANPPVPDGVTKHILAPGASGPNKHSAMPVEPVAAFVKHALPV